MSLDDYISVQLHQTDLQLTCYIKSQLEEFNLAPEQNLIMMLLWESDGMSQYQIAEKLKKDKTNIARMASNLEKKGFVIRYSCDIDRRSVKLHLTKKGKELGDKVIPIAERFNEQVCKGITEEDINTLSTILRKMRKNVESV